MKILNQALKDGRFTLTEYESKQILASYRIPVTREELVNNVDDLLKAAGQIGYPLVIKGCSEEIVHKTEKGLIRLDVRNDEEVTAAFEEITAAMDGVKNEAFV